MRRFHGGNTGSNPVGDANLTWNPLGSLEGFATTDSSDSSKNQSCSYHADDLSRIASVSCTNWAQNFSYDAFGNITKSGNQSYMPGYNSKNQAANASYDANGNSTNDGLSGIYGWDADNHTISLSGVISTTTITYDALGRTVEMGTSGTYKQILYGPDGSKLAVLSQATTLVKATIPLPGGATAVYSTAANGFDHFRHPDWLGSARLGTKWDHSVYSRESYAPFGEPYNESGAQDRSFTGQDEDTDNASNGLYDFLYRRYHPTQGRWISPDPAGMGAVNLLNPQTWNRYGYVVNNPMAMLDPLGLDGCTYGSLPYGATPCDEKPISVPANCGDSGCHTDPQYLTVTPDDSNPNYDASKHNPNCPEGYICVNVPGGGGGGSVSGGGGGGGTGNPNNGTPWYKSCTANAILKGAGTTVLDAIGIIPEGGTIAAAFSLFHGAAGASNGTKIAGRVAFGAGIITAASTSKDLSEADFSSTGIDRASNVVTGLQGLAGGAGIAKGLIEDIPIAGQAIAIGATALDLVGIGLEVAKCHR